MGNLEVNRMTAEEIAALFRLPWIELVGRAVEVHRRHHDPREIQVCVLLSVKTGGCPEDCAYCPQSARYDTGVEPHALLSEEEMLGAARAARAAGATRFCMGAAWRELKDGPQFDALLRTIRSIKQEGGLEVCCTLGMLGERQARQLKEAGLDAYNHNLDTSPSFYDRIITTRTYADRIETLNHVARAGISVCCGGILGMGETEQDRIDLLAALSELDTPPESIPINALVPVPGTPLAEQGRVSVWEMVRMIAATRIVFPHARVRLSAGRLELSVSEQALCFLAGANSIFAGEKLLTTPNPSADADAAMFELLGLAPKPASDSRAFASSG